MKNPKIYFNSLSTKGKLGLVTVGVTGVITAIAIGFGGCSNKKSNSNNDVTPTQTVTQANNEVKATPTVAPTSTPTPTQAPKAEVKNEVTPTVEPTIVPEETIEKTEEEILAEIEAEIEAERNAQFVSYDEYRKTYLYFFDKYKNLFNNPKSSDAIVYYANYGLLTDETKEEVVGKFVVNDSKEVNNDLVGAFNDVINYNVNVYIGKISNSSIEKEPFKLSDATSKVEHKQTFEYLESLMDTMTTGSQEDAINAYYELYNQLIYGDADVKNEIEDATEKYDRIGYNGLTAGEKQLAIMNYGKVAPEIMNARILAGQITFTKEEEEKDWQTTWYYDPVSNTAIRSTIKDDFNTAIENTINTLYKGDGCVELVKKR